jgi:chromosome segregation ATPase
MSLLNAIKSLVQNSNEDARAKYRRLLLTDDPKSAKEVVELARELGRTPAEIEGDRELIQRAAALEPVAENMEELREAWTAARKALHAAQARAGEILEAARAEAASIVEPAARADRAARSAFERARDAGVELDKAEAEIERRLTAGVTFPAVVEPGPESGLSSAELAARDSVRRGSDDARQAQLEREARDLAAGRSKPPPVSGAMNDWDRRKIERATELGWTMPDWYRARWEAANKLPATVHGLVERPR